MVSFSGKCCYLHFEEEENPCPSLPALAETFPDFPTLLDYAVELDNQVSANLEVLKILQ